MNVGDEFDDQDAQGVWWSCRVVWTGDRGHWLSAQQPWPMASALAAPSRTLRPGSVLDRSWSHGSSVTSQTALRA